MKERIKQIKNEALEAIKLATDLASLENTERKYLGRKGLLREILRQITGLSETERPRIGQLINETRGEIERAIQEKKSKVYSLKFMVENFFDLTLPGQKIFLGHLHPSTQLKNEVAEIFQSMGFEILEGPEVDDEWYNFEALNIPAEHPARDMWDTFYLKSRINADQDADKRGHISANQHSNPPESVRNISLNPRDNQRESALLLRTHTSTMQVRVMEKRKPPLKICVIGKCFRHEATDATHEHTLYHIEGFAVDEKITLANLIYTLKSFLNALYKKEVKTRIRPGYFPFVEPGLEIDMECEVCSGKGCPVCKNTGWLEVVPGGMIHPKVFESAGYPKDKYTGFAFGAGLDRLVMMRHKIDDIRWLHSGDLRFLGQF